MSDDIIARLYCSYSDPPCESCTFCTARAEIERLWAAGDEMAELLQGYKCLCWTSKCRCGHDAVLDAWKKARRER